MKKFIFKFTMILMVFFNFIAQAAPVGTKFNYQGQLLENGVAVSGSYSFQFVIYANESGGPNLAVMPTISNVPVTNGLFAVELDFGDIHFDGEAVFLEIRVKEISQPVMSILEPRQSINNVPYAIQSAFVENGGSSQWQVITGGIGYTNDVKIGDVNSASDSQLTVDAVASPVRFKIGGSTKMIIRDNGGTSLGLNTTAPDNGLRVQGDATQSLTSHGFVKAGAFIECASGVSGGSERYFNNYNGTDFAVSNLFGSGNCLIDTPFNISDAYFVVSAVNIGGLASGSLVGNCAINTPTQLACQIHNTFGSLQDGELQIIFY